MAATRLSDDQKSEMVDRFRAGAASQDLAVSYGCSANTVIRVVRAAIDPQEYERLKQRRTGRRARPHVPEETSAGGAELDAAAPGTVAEPPPVGFDAAADGKDGPGQERVEQERVEQEALEEEGLEEDGLDDRRVLAIDDADDFGGDEDDDEQADEEDAEDFEDTEDFAEDIRVVPVATTVDDHAVCEARPLEQAALPASVYMLVDKTVELQARPLSEFPELGRLPAEEQARQALVVYANPRQAKRQCGRSQRVIKLPDARLLERTAPYLIAQGISRVVLEGAVYSLPGS
jgi:hypothetical protein